MTPSYLSEEQNVLNLNNQVSASDAQDFQRLKSSRIEAAFKGRLLLVYKPDGLSYEGRHKSPKILGTIKFHEFFCDGLDGADVQVEDMDSGEKQYVGHVPVRLFEYDVFIRIPPVFRLRWDARSTDQGVIRSMVFPVEIFTLNPSRSYSFGVTYAETPNRCKELYPDEKLNFNRG